MGLPGNCAARCTSFTGISSHDAIGTFSFSLRDTMSAGNLAAVLLRGVDEDVIGSALSADPTGLVSVLLLSFRKESLCVTLSLSSELKFSLAVSRLSGPRPAFLLGGAKLL